MEKGWCLSPWLPFGKHSAWSMVAASLLEPFDCGITLSHCLVCFLYVCKLLRVWFPSLKFSYISGHVDTINSVSSGFPGAKVEEIWILHATWILYILFTPKAILQCGNGGTVILWFVELRPQHIFGCHTDRGTSLCEPQSVPFLQGLLGLKLVSLTLPVGPKVCWHIWYSFSFWHLKQL